MKRWATLVAACLFGLVASAQVRNPRPAQADDPILAMLDSLQDARYFESRNFTDDTCLLNVHGFCPDLVPLFNDRTLAERLQKLDANSPFDLVFNESVRRFIEVYSVRKRVVVSRVLGLSHLYFPLFEEQLDRYNLPMELKYLAIVESALNPRAVSHSGAGGLWQFMYGTGKMFGLNNTSYVDERRDPYKATVAACKYLKYLYGMFGDWQMVLAAYNSGPGTVTKAIRRSGGKKTYWEVRPYLPTETQNYVPAFIAVNYIMNHASDHNLYPISPKREFFLPDTLHINRPVNLKRAADLMNVDVSDLQFLNPAYKLDVIPASEEGGIICLPGTKVGTFLSLQESIFRTSREAPVVYAQAAPVAETRKVAERRVWHKMKRGENLSSVARSYGVSMAELKRWNRLRRAPKANQTLVVWVQQEASKPIVAPTLASAKTDSVRVSALPVAGEDEPDVQVQSDSLAGAPPQSSPVKKRLVYYTIQRGDTLWNIANRYKGVTVDELRKLNKDAVSRGLRVGTRIAVPVGG
jgi:membrane-bound lytic murein transglycosylase D